MVVMDSAPYSRFGRFYRTLAEIFPVDVRAQILASDLPAALALNGDNHLLAHVVAFRYGLA